MLEENKVRYKNNRRIIILISVSFVLVVALPMLYFVFKDKKDRIVIEEPTTQVISSTPTISTTPTSISTSTPPSITLSSPALEPEESAQYVFISFDGSYDLDMWEKH